MELDSGFEPLLSHYEGDVLPLTLIKHIFEHCASVVQRSKLGIYTRGYMLLYYASYCLRTIGKSSPCGKCSIVPGT